LCNYACFYRKLDHFSFGIEIDDGQRYNIFDLGVHVNGIEFPVVKMGQARLRVSLLPQHTKEHLDRFVEVFEQSLDISNVLFNKFMDKLQEESNKP
jgi:glycine cleavage system protein P-like pyridoxal-binding family